LLVAYELHLRGIELSEDRAKEPLPVQGNRDELQQVMLNLVNNAVHAVRSLPTGVPRRVTLIAAAEQGQAIVRVRDSGPGVPEELVSQLFTPFFTTKDPGEGTGLGLSLSFRIIESHGGRLAYQALPGGGAEFWFSLPLQAEPSRRSPALPRRPSGPVERAALVADPDPGAELVVRALFEPAGYAVEVARSGSDALARLAARSWSVVIVDGAMSADGRRPLVEQVVAGTTGRVMVSTSDSALATRCRGLDVAVLPRPFLPRDLVAGVGDLLEPSERQ
jgi:CheY-like chemotaxis protein